MVAFSAALLPPELRGLAVIELGSRQEARDLVVRECPPPVALVAMAVGQPANAPQGVGLDQAAANRPGKHRAEAVDDQVRGAVRGAVLTPLVAVADDLDRLQVAEQLHLKSRESPVEPLLDVVEVRRRDAALEV